MQFIELMFALKKTVMLIYLKNIYNRSLRFLNRLVISNYFVSYFIIKRNYNR